MLIIIVLCFQAELSLVSSGAEVSNLMKTKKKGLFSVLRGSIIQLTECVRKIVTLREDKTTCWSHLPVFDASRSVPLWRDPVSYILLDKSTPVDCDYEGIDKN